MAEVRLQIHVNLEAFQRTSDPRADWLAPLTFPIWWEFDGTAYPQVNWEDFGGVVLGWWLMSAVRLWAGCDQDQFQFMDGPFSIGARMDRARQLVQLQPSGHTDTWTLRFTAFAEELLRATDRVCSDLAHVPAARDTTAALSKGAAVLRATLTPSPIT
jgi:hypothetical protein